MTTRQYRQSRTLAIIVLMLILVGLKVDGIPIQKPQEPPQAVEKRIRTVSIAEVKKEVKRSYKWVTVTAYCNCKKCTPGKNITASGKTPKPGMVAASRGMKFGTRVRINGKIYVVEDRLARRFDDRIDIFMGSHKEALKFGKRRIKVEVLGGEIK